MRRLGSVLFVLIFAEGAVGNVASGPGVSRGSAVLDAHVVFGLGILAFALWSLPAAVHFPRLAARRAALFTTVAIVATVLSGAVFLLTALPQGAVVDRVLAIADLIGSALMVLWGSADPSRSRVDDELRS